MDTEALLGRASVILEMDDPQSPDKPKVPAPTGADEETKISAKSKRKTLGEMWRSQKE